jgi:replicative DNA helicase
MTDELLRVPPHSLEAEQSLLGALLLDNMAWERVALIVTPKDFYKGAHRKIYEQIELLIETGNPADVVTVSQALKDAGILDEIGGSAYLGLMAQSTPSSLNVKRYAELVREKSTLRNVIRACSEVIELAWAPGSDPEQALDEAERRVFELRSRRIAKPPATFKQLLGKVFEAIDERFHSDKVDGITGLRTGFENLDQMTAGMHPGDLIIVAGRPSMGKTSLRDEHCRARRACGEATCSGVLARDGRRAARAAHARLGVARGPAQAAHRAIARRGLGEADAGMEKLQDAPYLIEETMALSVGSCGRGRGASRRKTRGSR